MARFSVAIRSETYQTLINDTLGDKKVAQNFVAEVSTCVALNPRLQECDAKTIISAGLLAQRLNLPLAPSLGFCHIIPYGNSATFQIGWKGLVQLAIRTGYYERIGVKPVRFGEVIGMDEFGDDIIKFDHKYDNEEIVGYCAYFKLTNGFVKSIYWTKDQCVKHALKYSAEYRKSKSGKWSEQFDEMAMKTVIKQLISKWGIMSTELITAVQADQAVVGDNDFTYVDNGSDVEENVDVKKTNITNKLD